MVLIKRLVGRRKIRGVTEEELAANPLFASRSQGAPLQEPPPSPAPAPPPALAPRTPAPVVHRAPPAAAVSSPPTDPPPPPPPVDPTAVADRIVEHLIARVRAQPSVEPSPPDSPAPAPAPATPVSGPQESVAGPPGAGQQAPPAPSLPALTPAEQEDRREREPTNAPETSAESPGTESADGEPWQLPQWQYNKKRARINQRQKRK